MRFWWRDMRGVIPIDNHSYYLFFFVIVISILFFRPAIDAHTLSSTESLTLSSNRTIISLGDDFELGFFKPAASLRDSDHWYIGIWFKKIPVRTYVWVANREYPLPSSAGTLKISGINLVLLNQFNKSVWSTNLTGAVASPVIAELLPNGNFVLKDSKSNGQDGLLWQSFDYPTDTLLPHMKLGLDLKTGNNRILRSWKNPYDPSSGYYWFKLEIRGLPEFFLWKDESLLLRSGPWDGTRFNGIPEMQRWQYIDVVSNFTENKEEVAYTYRVTTGNVYSRLTLSTDGFLQLFTWTQATQEWNIFWISSGDECNPYGRCGLFAYCDTNTSPVCNCIKGFQPRNLQEWILEDGLSECLRKKQLSCNGDEFLQLKNMKLPDTAGVTVDRRIGLKECEQRCNRNCNCTAFANTDIQNGESGCVIWTGGLRDIRKYAAAGQDLYVRLAADALEKAKNRSRKRIGLSVGKIIGLSVGGATLLLFLSFLIIFFWKRRYNQASAFPGLTEDFEMPLLEYDVVAMATNDFSSCNKLGAGGFGTVYKGRLRGGEEIAVKRLSEVSSQGRAEFETEMKLIAKLQHINLIRLLACYADAAEKMLVYEYLENRSLDYFIFDKTKGYMLNWKKRFDIINGIARGLLYLHQDSRCRVIHRDLKASNILLDKNMIPKISDFGMARIFAGNQEEASTRRIVGTYGYMAPEYAMDGVYSIKSDVFSFGVLLLEIISGKKNRGFYDSDRDKNLLSYTWRNWYEGTGLEIVDPIIVESSPSTYRPQEILRCIQIGLLCVQDYAEDRPTTSSVVVMLGSEKAEIPQPQPPGYCLVSSTSETGSSSSSSGDCTLNDVTLSAVEGR